MSEIEKMQRYIKRAKLPEDPTDKYCFCLGELNAIGRLTKVDMFHALCLVFEYGKAKGYRQAKAERRAEA